MDFGVRGIGGEIKLFPPPTYHGELDKWDDWSWHLKRYVGLYKPLAKTMTDEIETNAQKVVTDSLCANCYCSRNSWLTCWPRSLMELRERLSGMKTQRMASTFGEDCSISFHCRAELVQRIS